jgi:hypothetical protein
VTCTVSDISPRDLVSLPRPVDADMSCSFDTACICSVCLPGRRGLVKHSAQRGRLAVRSAGCGGHNQPCPRMATGVGGCIFCHLLCAAPVTFHECRYAVMSLVSDEDALAALFEHGCSLSHLPTLLLGPARLKALKAPPWALEQMTSLSSRKQRASCSRPAAAGSSLSACPQMQWSHCCGWPAAW